MAGRNPRNKFSAIHYFALSENGVRRDGGRKAVLCPARIGKGLPPSCRAKCAAVAVAERAGVRAIAAKPVKFSAVAGAVERSGANRPRRRLQAPQRPSSFQRREWILWQAGNWSCGGNGEGGCFLAPGGFPRSGRAGEGLLLVHPPGVFFTSNPWRGRAVETLPREGGFDWLSSSRNGIRSFRSG